MEPAGNEGAKVLVPASGAVTAAKELAVDLETVLRLTEQNNLRIALARKRLEESLLAYQVASRSCVPNLLRPEAHQCITAEANVWRQRAELSQVTHDTLQEAGETYIDWLSVRQQEAVAREVEGYLRPLLARTENLQKTEPAVGHLVETIQATIIAQQRNAVTLQEQGDMAGDKLAYLLGAGHVLLVPRSSALVPLDVVDVTPPIQVPAVRAASAGPTVRELEGLWAVLQKGIDQARLLQLGADCKGPQSKPALQLQVAASKRDEVGLTLEDTRQRLALGAREAYQLIGSACAQIGLNAQELQHAQEAYRLSNLRLRELGPDKADLLTVEVLQSIHALGAAKSHFLASLNAHDKAQVRLLLLVPAEKHIDPPGSERGH
jgi:outer membrane protein TolC